jgi:hypothetical protein
VAGSSRNKANSAKLEQELGLSLAISYNILWPYVCGLTLELFLMVFGETYFDLLTLIFYVNSYVFPLWSAMDKGKQTDDRSFLNYK